MKEFHPLHHKLPDLQKSEEVQDAVVKHARLTGEKAPSTAEGKLDVYMERLENIFLNEDETTRKRNIELLRDSIHDAYIIKSENVPESYFELQMQVARERGQHVETIDDATREKMIEVIIEDQTKSLDSWIDYLTSNDAMYPTWFKYFVFRNIAKLSQFDKALGKFKERTASTTAPFPDIYREALAQVADLYQSAQRDKTLFNDPDFQSFLSKKFPAQYADKIQATLEHSQEDREQIEGVWVKYEQGDDDGAKKLYDSLQGRGTGWCTAGHSTAQTQIESGDFYVFYSNDSKGLPVHPRLAIRMEDDHIGEVRGILPHQEVEPILQETLDAKLADFGHEADTYKKKSSDMKRLTIIEKVMNEEKEITKEDLRFLYELDEEIEGFGYERDPRIKELQSKRNRQEDIQTLCNCSQEHLATDFTNINEQTQVFCEDTGDKITIIDFREDKHKNKLPQLLELVQSIKEAGSPARPDLAMEGGVVHVRIDHEKVKDIATAIQSFKDADNGSRSYVWDEWIKAPHTPLASLSFDVVTLSYNADPNTRRSSEKILEDMDKLGLRPLTLEEMIATGITHPEFTKDISRYFIGLTKYSLGGDSYVPNLCRYGVKRGLNWYGWGLEWNEDGRFLAVCK